MRIATPPPEATVDTLSVPPTFSVVIAAYQVADVVGEAVASALRQTEPPHEIVVCDDGSTDDLDSALGPFRDQVVVIRKENGGEASAKNAGARAATAEFVAILDADDIYLPERLAALGSLAAERPDLDIMTTDAHIEVDGRTVRRAYTSTWSFATHDQRRAILERNFLFGHVAVRRELLLNAGGFDESIARATDWDCWIRLLLDGAAAGAVLEPLSRYRVRAMSLSVDRGGMLEGGLRALGNGLNHPRISPAERAVARQTIARLKGELELIQLRDSLRERAPDARHRAGAIALQRSTRMPTRLKAAAAMIAPRTAGRLLRRRQGRAWVGAGGTTVDDA